MQHALRLELDIFFVFTPDSFITQTVGSRSTMTEGLYPCWSNRVVSIEDTADLI